MISSKNIHALVIAAPPQPTLEITSACIEAGKPVLATKPLIPKVPWPMPLRAAFYVDYVHLWSPCWRSLKQICLRHRIYSISSSFHGQGPARTFSPLLDYGSHALAMVHDLCPPCEEISFSSAKEISHEISHEISPSHGILTAATGKTTSGITVKILTGNCLTKEHPEPTRKVEVTFLDGRKVTYEEKLPERQDTGTTPPTGLLTFCKRHERIPHDGLKGQDPITALSKEFIDDIAEERASPYLADLSYRVFASLRKIQRAVASGR